MHESYNIQLSKIIKELSLEALYLPKSEDDIFVSSREVNRPGIELNGFYDYFDNQRINILGRAETAMLENFSPEKNKQAVEKFFSMKPPAVIVSRGLETGENLLECAKKYEVPLLLSQDSTSNIVAALVAYLNVVLAPRITRHGVLVEVYGEGILLVGDSGVGKSETAIEIVKRGHRLIADDAVEIRRVSRKSLVGQAPDNIRHFIELRGIGMINAKSIFGMGAVKIQEKIDMVINLELWDNTKVYDRMGIDNIYTEILGIEVPVMTIPVKPGRNLAIIIEVAAMNNRQKKMGYNAAHELLTNLGVDLSLMPGENIKKDLDI
ncbi:MAG: HPr(Ser) kinase/phosphatase [Clostridia bacterium]